VVLYGLGHIYSSGKELIASIPFGLLLCYLTILNQSVYPSIILHLSIALPYEIILLLKTKPFTKKIFV